MCYKVVEVHDECDHETKNLIPCEGMMDEGTCTAKPEDTKDRIGKATTPCQKCQDEQADDAALEEALKKIAEDPALAPAPKTAIKPAGDLGTFKYRNRWTKCGHCTDPQESGVERQHEGDPEWLDFSQEGHCNGCSILHPRVYAERRAQGLLDGDDPHGALKAKLLPAAGGSSNAGAGTKDPAFNVPDDEEDDGGRHFVPSRSPSPHQIPTITRGKGKGRASKPEETYASRHGAAEPAVPEYESDAEREDESPVHSGDEGHTEGVKPGKSKAPKYGSSDEEDDDEESDDGEDDDEVEEPHPRGRKITKHAIGSGSRGSSSKSGTMGTRRHRARSSSSNYSQGEEDGPPDWSSQPPPGSPPPPMASGALRPPPRNSARRNARPSAED